MNATLELNRTGQSLWLDNITRELLTSGTLRRHIEELSVTGLTSNPTIFDQAMKRGVAYDEDFRRLASSNLSVEEVFFEVALQDLIRAADLFRPVHDHTAHFDGWVSLEVSPHLAHDASSTIAQARDLHARAGRPNLFIKIPGTREGLLAIEEAIFSGVAVNVTLLFSPDHYVAAAEAWLRGIERRIEAGLSPDVASVASLFVSRWDVAIGDKVPVTLRNRLGLAIGRRAYEVYRRLLSSPRWLRVMNAGARPQRLLFASTGTKDPKVSDVLYVEGLVAPLTINTMPENTLNAFADHGWVGEPIEAAGGDSAALLAEFGKAGVNPRGARRDAAARRCGGLRQVLGQSHRDRW
jgi:transaldolase